MNADDCNGHSYMSGKQKTKSFEQSVSPLSSLYPVNSIKVEEDSDDEPVGALQPERRKGERDDREDTIEEGSGELGGRVGRGSAGSGYGELASPQPASPGPIRLPNGKLQCDVCGMNCIGPNVLMVHKRIHTGERPFQCTQCGASFTQKGNLLRHIKLHSGEKPFKCPFCNYACRRRDALSGHIRTHTVPSLTVVKPYKCSYCGRSYKQQITLEEHLERCHNYLKCLQNHQPALSMEPMSEPEAVLQPSTEKLSFIDRLVNTITKRKRSTPQKFLGEFSPSPTVSNGYSNGPSNGCHDFKDKFDTESTADEQQSTVVTAPTSNSNNYHLLPNLQYIAPALPSTSIQVQVVDREGRAVRSFRCEHCRMFFLDHVMFTIHMGCHGFHQPFQCNVCGHCSCNRYQFTSHIIRGEHQVG
uniref:IKAROS family zinc finger 4 n=1 Tax=Salmo trutta TaxID=8032 RepID=A0A674AUC2_SALTR